MATEAVPVTSDVSWVRSAMPSWITSGGCGGGYRRKYMGKRIDVSEIPPVIGTLYPAPFDLPCRKRERQKLGDSAGLTQFGVNLLRLPPGAWSSQRHWHALSDEFVYVLAGEVCS